MNHIDRLIIAAKRAAKANGKGFAVGSVDYDQDTGIYKAVPHSWDGVKGSGNEYESRLPEWWCRDYATHKDAVKALYRLFDSFGVSEDDSVIYTINYE